MDISPPRRSTSFDHLHSEEEEDPARRVVTPRPAGGATTPNESATEERRTPVGKISVPFLSTNVLTTTDSPSEKDLISSALNLIDDMDEASPDQQQQEQDERRAVLDGRAPPPPPSRYPQAAVAENDHNGIEEYDDDVSVQSIQRIMCPRAASFGSANKRMGGRWDTNLMEDSMPGLVSFCHGSFASLGGGTMNGSRTSLFGAGEDDNSVSSLECSVRNSQQPRTQQHGELILDRSSNHNPSAPHQQGRRPLGDNNNVLQPLARVAPDGKHQEVRWGGGEVHRSSEALPTVSRRQSREV
jgi:hypothetical protein